MFHQMAPWSASQQNLANGIHQDLHIPLKHTHFGELFVVIMYLKLSMSETLEKMLTA